MNYPGELPGNIILNCDYPTTKDTVKVFQENGEYKAEITYYPLGFRYCHEIVYPILPTYLEEYEEATKNEEQWLACFGNNECYDLWLIPVPEGEHFEAPGDGLIDEHPPIFMKDGVSYKLYLATVED